MPEDSLPCLLAGTGMGSTLPLNGIGTSPTLNSTNNCPLIALSHSLLLGALLACPATASSISLARPWRPFFFSSRPQTPFPARDKLQYPRQRPIASSPTNPTAVLLQVDYLRYARPQDEQIQPSSPASLPSFGAPFAGVPCLVPCYTLYSSRMHDMMHGPTHLLVSSPPPVPLPGIGTWICHVNVARSLEM